MISSGSCSLLIRGENLDFNDIANNLLIIPTKIIKKGDTISKSIGRSQYDIWDYEIKFNENRTLDDTLASLLNTIEPFKIYLHGLTDISDIFIKCYLQSDFAQINFDISPKVLKKLGNMNIKFKISILSWGNVEL